MGTPVVITSTVLLLYMFSIPVAPQQANVQQPQAFQVRLPDRQNKAEAAAAAQGEKNIEYLNSLLKKRKSKVSNDDTGDKQTLKSRVKRKKKRSKSLDSKLSIKRTPSPVNVGKPQEFEQKDSIVSQNNQKVVAPVLGGANNNSGGANIGGGANINDVGGAKNNGVGSNNLIENKIKPHFQSAFNNNNDDNNALKRAETNNNVVNSEARVKVIETGGVKQVPRPQDSLPVLADNIVRVGDQDREKPLDVVGGPNMMHNPGALRGDVQSNVRLNQADTPLRNSDNNLQDEKPVQIKNDLREVAHDEVRVSSEDEVVKAKDNIIHDNNNQIRVDEQPVHNQENNRNWQPIVNNNPPPMQQHQQQANNKPKKQDSQRIMWDWSDFLINYEQYVMPEQKVRRAPHATTGEPWPLPQYYITSQTKLFRLDREKFHFRISKETCDIIEKAIERYKDYILYDSVQDMYDNLQHAQGSSLEDVYEKYGDEVHTQAGYIDELNITLMKKKC